MHHYVGFWQIGSHICTHAYYKVFQNYHVPLTLFLRFVSSIELSETSKYSALSLQSFLNTLYVA